MRHVIAVDFDGCLCQDRWPEIGEPNWPAIAALLELQKRGVALILNTCREGELLEKAVLWCGYRGLSFDAVNENLPERIEAYGGDCRKISANEYWDDRAVRVPPPPPTAADLIKEERDTLMKRHREQVARQTPEVQLLPQE